MVDFTIGWYCFTPVFNLKPKLKQTTLFVNCIKPQAQSIDNFQSTYNHSHKTTCGDESLTTQLSKTNSFKKVSHNSFAFEFRLIILSAGVLCVVNTSFYACYVFQPTIKFKLNQQQKHLQHTTRPFNKQKPNILSKNHKTLNWKLKNVSIDKINI